MTSPPRIIRIYRKSLFRLLLEYLKEEINVRKHF
nr:MAG TPA: hypothetical protein [Caudoviricetes sp.]